MYRKITINKEQNERNTELNFNPGGQFDFLTIQRVEQSQLQEYCDC